MDNQYSLNQTLKNLVEVLQCQCDTKVVVDGDIHINTEDLNKEDTQIKIQGILDTFKNNTQSQLSDIFSNLQVALMNGQVNSKEQIERLEELIQAVQGTFSGNTIAQEITLRDFKTQNLDKLQEILDAIINDTCDVSELAQENTLNNFYVRNHADLQNIRGALDDVLIELENLFDNSGLAMDATILFFANQTNANFQEVISALQKNRPVEMAYNSDNLLNYVLFENGLIANISYNQNKQIQTINWVEP